MGERIVLPAETAAVQLLGDVPVREFARHLRLTREDFAIALENPPSMLPMTRARLALLLISRADATTDPRFARWLADRIMYGALHVAIDNTAREAGLEGDRLDVVVAKLKLELLGPDYIDREREQRPPWLDPDDGDDLWGPE